MPKKEDRIKIVLEDENLAAWMVINNTFTWKKDQHYDPAENYWTGVLFQLGTYTNVSTGDHLPPFGSIKFLKDGIEVGLFTTNDFRRGDPMWVNIVVGAPGSKKNPPMKQAHLKALRVSKNPAPGTLDYYFKPFPGGITFWSETGFKMKMGREQGTHYELVFESKEGDPVAFQIYKGEHPQNMPSFNEIQILNIPGLPEGSHSSPPQDP